MSTAIELVGLVIAFFSLVLHYVSSPDACGLADSTAISRWSLKTIYRWDYLDWKVIVQYAHPVLTSKDAINILMVQEDLCVERLRSIPDVNVTELYQLSDGYSSSMQMNAVPKLVFTLCGAEDQREIPLEDLPRHHWTIAKAIEKDMAQRCLSSVLCKVSWCNLMNDIGVDLALVQSTELINVDLIPSSLNAPPVQIHLSDLIDLGLLLGMKVVGVDEDNHILTMTGKHCSITTRYCKGVGQLSRYSGMASQVLPIIRAAKPKELRIAMDTAAGILQLGDSFAPTWDWGYNSVDLVLGTVLGKAEGEGWEEINIKDIMGLLEGDSDVKWGVSNMAVVNAFPNVLLHSWTIEERQSACQAAFDQIHRSVKFIKAPHNLFHAIQKNGVDILVMGNFKAANNYGCEYGGLHSWLSTNLAVFTSRLARCWPVDGITDSIPILSCLYTILMEDALGTEWCKVYHQGDVTLADQTDSGDEELDWKMTANSLLWMQIMMLDTWIGRKVDLLTRRVSDEVAVPADLAAATTCANISMQLLQTTVWKKSRMEFARAYLVRLVEGVDGNPVSCISMGVGDGVAQPTLGPAGWENMPFGSPEHWAAIDAVLTIRSMLLVYQLEIMNDLSALLRLHRFNLVVLLA
ncbi:hypothetical protein JAAARDRAFT_51853 [Jaapia argillacea MUCL 33604]|uniref:Uncharacterized protein n=1 Tax=Jaapia argillacea MUCL 33604 TaxID=933084 RepID=A0A067P358_9AGAM|nr:hypothetical protein JAAARDRAFT_51853 [Jaapia argillacea MUCL 33604]